MSGKFLPIIVFPFFAPNIRNGNLEMKPILSEKGFGVHIILKVELVGGTGENRYKYDRILEEYVIFQSDIIDGEYAELIIEFIEGLYYNRITSDVAVPFAALLLYTHLTHLIEEYNLDISDQIFLGRCKTRKQIGFQSSMESKNNGNSLDYYTEKNSTETSHKEVASLRFNRS